MVQWNLKITDVVKPLILVIAFLFVLHSPVYVEMAVAQSTLKKCPKSKNKRWHDCVGKWSDGEGYTYEGAWKDDERHGQGTSTFARGDKYVGEFKDDNANGQGTYTFANGGEYVGEFKDGLPNGQGIETSSNGSRYVGEYKDGKYNGQGTYTTADGDKYIGEFKDGQQNGQGTYTTADGDKYVGEYKDGQRNGQGTYTTADGYKYVGEYKDGQRNGQGTNTFADGHKYVGEYKDGDYNGQGTFTYPNGDKYVGEFKDGKYNGQGTFTYPNGDSFIGTYQSEKRDGQGTYVWKDGSKYIGQWKDGLPTNDGILTKSSGSVITAAQYKSAAVYDADGNMTSPDVLTYTDGTVQQQVAQTISEQSAQQQPKAANDNTRRLALVVGIDIYLNVPQLQKAVNDSKAVSTALQQIGYDVVSVENPDRRTLSSKLQEFQGKIQPGDTAFFFFAGHGVALGPDNILLAADVPKLEPGQDDIAKDEGFSVDNIIRRFQKQGAKTAMLVLDACRNNPFETDGTRSVGNTRGLAKQDAPEGVFVLFSAGLGQEALDRLSDEDPDPNSVFTRKLIPALMTPSITHNDLAKRLQKDVSELAAIINVKQQPAYYDQIIGEVVINPQ